MMNKARKKNYKPGMAKRLVRGSLILSFTRFVSSRVVRFFENGAGSVLFRTVKKVDRFARYKVTGPLFKKVELRKKFAMPVRNKVSSFFAKNPVFEKFRGLQAKALNSSLRTLGIFLFVFGIYAAAIFSLKRYVSLSIGAADTDDLIVSAITLIGGLLLTFFGDKSIISVLGSSKITGTLLSNVLGLNDSSLYRTSKQKHKTSIGMSFLLGSVLGVLTMFVSPIRILLYIAAFIAVITVINVPEFGLFGSVAAMFCLPTKYLGWITLITLASYLLKCLRLKRILRFGSADAVMLVLAVIMFLSCLAGGLAPGECYLFCFMSMYFLAKNAISSEKLAEQASNALCLGVFAGMILYIIGEFALMIPHSQFRAFAEFISANRLSVDMLAVSVAAVMPFALSSFSSNTSRKGNRLFILLSAACAFVSDSFLFYVLLAVALFVYVAMAFKAPFGAALAAGILLPPSLAIISDFTYSRAVSAFADKAYDAALGIQGTADNFWSGITAVGGTGTAFIFGVGALLVLQRILSGSVLVKAQKTNMVCGTVAASAVMILIQSVMFNMFADLRVLLLMWMVLGMCGSVYKVYYSTQYIGEEE